MFGKVLDSIKDMTYVKVTKANWRKIEDLFARKEQTITEQEKTLKIQKQLIEEQDKKLKELEKYKANDDMVYIYEEICKKYKKENSELKEELEKLSKSIIKMDKKVQSVLSLESAYLQRIIKAESKARYNSCPEYQEVGDSIVEFYA